MRNATVCSMAFIAILFFGSSSVFGQFTWTKDTHSPVLTGVSGTWYKHVFSPSVLYNADSTRYEMWFAGIGNFDIPPAQYGFAVSPDGVHWTIHGTPVMSPTAATWDSQNLDVVTVIRENHSYKMWYTAYASGAANPTYIGFATSGDGIHWAKYAGNPVLGPGTASWETSGPYGCAVVPVSGGYKMWYGAFGTSGSGIGYASSVDGIAWVRDSLHNPVLNSGAAGTWDGGMVELPVVLRIDSRYVMWYTGQQSDATGFSTVAFGIAVSDDGVTGWTKYAGNPVLSPTPGAWDETLTGTTAVLQRGDTIHMWHDGYRSPIETYQFRIGHATSRLDAGTIRRVPFQYATIQTAIDSARNGDTVLVSDGTYYENIRFKGKSIVVASTYLTTGDTSHIARTIIDGSHATNPDSGSVVYFVDGEDTTSVLCGFTVTAGSGTPYHYEGSWWWREGGGIYCASAGARLVRNNIVRNRVTAKTAGGGGVAANHAGQVLPFLILEDNRITDNYVFGDSAGSWGSGGGADINGLSVRITGNQFERDTVVAVGVAIAGGMNLGGVSDTYPGGLVQGNVFRNNIVDGRIPGGDGAAVGGGVFCFGTAAVLFLENSFLGNTALAGTGGWAEGGGICIDDEDVPGPGRKTVSRNRFLGNRVQAQDYSERGGAIDLYHTVATVSGNLIADNSAAGSPAARGGGIRSINSSFRIENNIITRNRSGVWGGGINIQNPPTYGTEQVIVNNTFVGNKATTGGGLDIANAANVVAFNNILWGDTATIGPEINATGAAPVIQYCDVAGGYPGGGNINSDPSFVDSSYRLSDRSLCIGAGIDSLQIGSVFYSVPRACYYGSSRPNPTGSKPDIGACENYRDAPLSGLVGGDPIMPSAYELKQNYPNPFNPTTVVIYQLPVVSLVRLVVYDLLGREVAVLVDEKKEPGRYEVKFDGSGLSSGVYLYRLQAGTFTETKKFLLVR